MREAGPDSAPGAAPRSAVAGVRVSRSLFSLILMGGGSRIRDDADALTMRRCRSARGPPIETNRMTTVRDGMVTDM
ncbi:hypothetical protein Sru01_04860 [Sphaerisporangium rufum]|uniref:Uncharacterized protein n=1 Tax=Sphaerisporangium rufum TaxID=1381558 RepID=A0A919QWP2_9ACTN|nr:hypothetical protein Sru01_04860 [Sphaerisporangium rufum]